MGKGTCLKVRELASFLITKVQLNGVYSLISPLQKDCHFPKVNQTPRCFYQGRVTWMLCIQHTGSMVYLYYASLTSFVFCSINKHTKIFCRTVLDFMLHKWYILVPETALLAEVCTGSWSQHQMYSSQPFLFPSPSVIGDKVKFASFLNVWIFYICIFETSAKSSQILRPVFRLSCFLLEENISHDHDRSHLE